MQEIHSAFWGGKDAIFRVYPEETRRCLADTASLDPDFVLTKETITGEKTQKIRF